MLFDIETTLLKIYSHFCRSSVRCQELTNYFEFIEEKQQVNSHILIVEYCVNTMFSISVILKHIKIRWLSLLRSIERLIGAHPIVKSYFLNLENEECPELLLEFFTSHKSNGFALKTYICINSSYFYR